LCGPCDDDPGQEFAALTRSKEIYETLHPETRPEQPSPRHEPIIGAPCYRQAQALKIVRCSSENIHS